MKRILVLLSLLFVGGLVCLGGLCGCAGGSPDKTGYISITADEAKELMDTRSGCIILDVRTEEEFASGHIPGAMLIPDDEIAARAEGELPDRNQLILVYCRSGRRSKLASEHLARMGYTNIREFGGIIEWPYEVVTE